MAPFGRASPAEERHRGLPGRLCSLVRCRQRAARVVRRELALYAAHRALQGAGKRCTAWQSGGQKWEHATLPRRTNATDAMRGEASDFAAMRDAFRNAGLCTESTPAALVESWCARRDDASDGEDSLYVPSPQRVKIRRRLAEACVGSPRFVRRAAEAAAVERLNRRRAVRALAAVVARGRAARLLARRADAFRAARGLSEWRKAVEAVRRRAAADDLLDAYADARRTQRGLGRWRRGAARLRRRRRLRTHGRRAFHRWAKLIRYARRLRAARVFGVLKRAAQRRRRRELVVADAYRRARLRLVLEAWVPVCVEINQCAGCTTILY